MTDVTRILNAIEQGDQRAADELLALVYEELRLLAAQKMTQERPGQTLEATALVHEAYIRLVGTEDQSWDSNPRSSSSTMCEPAGNFRPELVSLVLCSPSIRHSLRHLFLFRSLQPVWRCLCNEYALPINTKKHA